MSQGKRCRPRPKRQSRQGINFSNRYKAKAKSRQTVSEARKSITKEKRHSSRRRSRHLSLSSCVNRSSTMPSIMLWWSNCRQYRLVTRISSSDSSRTLMKLPSFSPSSSLNRIQRQRVLWINQCARRAKLGASSLQRPDSMISLSLKKVR